MSECNPNSRRRVATFQRRVPSFFEHKVFVIMAEIFDTNGFRRNTSVSIEDNRALYMVKIRTWQLLDLRD